MEGQTMAAFLVSMAAAAAAASPAQPSGAARDVHGHSVQSETIIVTAPFVRDRIDSLTPVSVLTRETLAREMRSTIGETLARQPGVSATSFGPNASRPILRGFQGERVRVLTDGIGAFDVSNTSVDHAVAINPLLAERIEVVRGPSALLFGSSAIGGVVNVLDARIPRVVPDEVVHVEAIGSYGSAADERTASGAVDLPVGDKLVLHADGSYSKSGDLDTGGYILSPALRAEALASGDPEIEELADLKGKLPNSASRTWTAGAGASLITDGGNLGVSVSRYDSLYGVPNRYSVEPEGHDHEEEGEEEHHEHGNVRIDMRQTRVDVRGEVRMGGFLDSLRVRAGFADYRHDELEETGEIGTTFRAEGWEGRAELVQADRGGWKGALGAQLMLRSMSIVGEEKFLPRNETQQYGLFTVQDYQSGPLKVEAGARIERSSLSAAADADIGNPDLERRFTTFSGSAGASYAVLPQWRLGVNISRSARAPSAEELFANGPHAGTQSFEVGDPSLKSERSWGAELFVRHQGENASLELSAFKSWFSNYIDQIATGAVEDELPVYQYVQGRARYWGVEAQGSATLASLGDWALSADALADYVRATLSDVGPAPRIPPLRLLGGLELKQGDVWALRGEVEHATRQDRVAANETPTAAYTLANLAVQWMPLGDRITLTVAANNLFDVAARRHASFLKDHAPLAGRDIRLSVRTRF
ncbi:TonB-dependent receptor [Tardibacter chloracetimidivorans]|uniref:TonB-dependent receptor n=2 Tax=Tardibacter chloracetimidivorans TaxID=1921510 RepID=A0A1L3ZWN0_9SPHN|nr:TonB-dependent receptor [Tardibacter chloracetimidivorans]